MRSHRLVTILTLAVLASACSRFVAIEPMDTIELDRPQETSVVVAADGSELAALHAEQDREVVPLDRVPEVVRDAVVATEDHRFYAHEGVDARAIARALVRNVTSGEIVQGGSTITQQLAKNAVTGDDRTLERKLREASVAVQLESQFTKDEILERYLNTVYFGNGAYGVQAAARRYFGTDVSSLGLRQAALLAGLLQAPATHDPFAHPDAALRRRNLVLALMERHGYVPRDAAATAAEQPLGVKAAAGHDLWQAPYFVSYVLDLLQHDPAFAVLGGDAESRADAVFRGGLRIETTLDRGWQAAAEGALQATLSEPGDPSGALVALDPRTGGIRAMVGGRDYDDPDDPVARFNLATDARRQPGSTFKALVLATALAQGASLEDVYHAPATITVPARPPHELENWTVRNYTDVDFGELTLREATAYSVNAVYAQLIQDIGPQAVIETARAMGVRQRLRPLRSLALGAQEVSVLDMANVEATLAAGGVYRPTSAVTRIVGPDGTVLYERGMVRGKRVLDEAVAWLVTTALQDVVAHGTGSRADIRRPVAGKTGTTQDGADAWFTGYTPDLAAAVWMGFHQGAIPMEPPRTRIRVEGGNWPAETFARFALRALDHTPAHDFPIPESELVRVEVDTTRNCLPNPYTPPEVVAERPYLEGTEPTEVCTQPTGAPRTDVPGVVGLPLSAAERLLTGAGFTVQRTDEFSVELPPGYVVRQDPAPGPDQQLEHGYVVTVYVSSADRTDTEVPAVLNASFEDATATLEDAGFVVEVVEECPGGGLDCTGARERPGTVWQQSPDPGGRAIVHSVVELTVYPDVDPSATG